VSALTDLSNNINRGNNLEGSGGSKGSLPKFHCDMEEQKTGLHGLG
jgi:hypothetical protein